MGASFEAVWSRVTSGGDDGLAELHRRLRREAEIRRLCEAQQRQRIAPAVRETLALLGRHAAGRYRQLLALHFLCIGGVWKPPEAPEGSLRLPQALCEIYRMLSEDTGAAAEAESKLGPDASALLQQMAEEMRADASALRRLAEKLL